MKKNITIFNLKNCHFFGGKIVFVMDLLNLVAMLKCHACRAYEKIADSYFFFFSVRFFMVELGPFQTSCI